MPDQTTILLGTLILFIGLLLAITALVLSSFQRVDGARKSGAVVIIEPFPIILASDLGTARQPLVLAIFLLVALIVFYLVQIF